MPIDYCALVLLKRVLSMPKPIMIDGFWKAVEEELKLMPLEILQKALLSWKLRCRFIAQKQGCQNEH